MKQKSSKNFIIITMKLLEEQKSGFPCGSSGFSKLFLSHRHAQFFIYAYHFFACFSLRFDVIDNFLRKNFSRTYERNPRRVRYDGGNADSACGLCYMNAFSLLRNLCPRQPQRQRDFLFCSAVSCLAVSIDQPSCLGKHAPSGQPGRLDKRAPVKPVNPADGHSRYKR